MDSTALEVVLVTLSYEYAIQKIVPSHIMRTFDKILTNRKNLQKMIPRTLASQRYKNVAVTCLVTKQTLWERINACLQLKLLEEHL